MTASVYGPVSSRRFGQSIGINFLPPKTCSYSCIYCQLDRTNPLTMTRLASDEPEEIARQVETRLNELANTSQQVDTLTFVSNGEPSLDLNIGRAIRFLMALEIPIAVITNASLMFIPEVREDMAEADIVSAKIDSVIESSWRALNRPHKKLQLSEILTGIQEFSKIFQGKLYSETMLVKNINDDLGDLEETALFINQIKVQKAYLGLPLRPPCEKWVSPPFPKRLSEIYQIFKKYSDVYMMMNLPLTELNVESSPIQKLLEILMVHPLSEKEILAYFKKNNLPKRLIQTMESKGKITGNIVDETIYYLRNYQQKD